MLESKVLALRLVSAGAWARPLKAFKYHRGGRPSRDPPCSAVYPSCALPPAYVRGRPCPGAGVGARLQASEGGRAPRLPFPARRTEVRRQPVAWPVWSQMRHFVVLRRQTWDAAVRNCEAMGGVLAMAKTADEYAALVEAAMASIMDPQTASLLSSRRVFPAEALQSEFIFAFRFWIRGRKVNGVWQWLDGSALSEGFTWWGFDSPEYDSGDVTCLSLNVQRRGEHQDLHTAWRNDKCQDDLLSICEATAFPPMAPPPPLPPALPALPALLPLPPMLPAPPILCCLSFIDETHHIGQRPVYDGDCCADESPFLCCRCNLFCAPSAAVYLLCFAAVLAGPRLLWRCARGGWWRRTATSTRTPLATAGRERPRGRLADALVLTGQLLIPIALLPLIFEAVAILAGGRLQLTPFKSYRARAHRWTSLLPTAFTLQLLGVRPSRGDVRSVLRCALFFVLASASVSVVVLLDVRRHRVYTSPWVQGLLIPLVGLVGTLRLLPILLVRPLTQPSPELAAWKHRRLWGVWRAGLVVYGLWTMGLCIATYVCSDDRLCNLSMDTREPFIAWERAYLIFVSLQGLGYSLLLRPDFRIRILVLSTLSTHTLPQRDQPWRGLRHHWCRALHFLVSPGHLWVRGTQRVDPNGCERQAAIANACDEHWWTRIRGGRVGGQPTGPLRTCQPSACQRLRKWL